MPYVIPIDQVNQLTAVNDYAVIPFGASTEQVWTTNTYLAQWAAGAITSPASLEGLDPVSQAMELVQSRCTAIPAPDCAQAAQLAQQYGQMVANAYASGGASTGTIPAAGVPSPAPVTTSAPTAAVTPSTGATGAAAPGGLTPHFVSSAPATGAIPHFASSYGTSLAPRDIASGALGGATAGIPAAAATFGISIVVGAILGALFGGIFGGTDLNSINKAIQQLRQALADGLDEVTRFTWAVGNGVAATWEAFALTWDNFFDSFWQDFKNVWNAVWTHLAQTIPAILTIIHNLRQKLDEIYKKYIQKILFWIQLARVFLAYLKLLHVPFAQKLDKIITQIQAAVFAPFLYVLGILNVYGAWFNLVFTRHLTLQRPVFINTMYEYQADWINMFWAAQAGELGPVGQLGPAAQGFSSFTAGPGGGSGATQPGETTSDIVDIVVACAWITNFAATESGEVADVAQGALLHLKAELGL